MTSGHGTYDQICVGARVTRIEQKKKKIHRKSRLGTLIDDERINHLW